jgi:hypothetical protein
MLRLGFGWIALLTMTASCGGTVTVPDGAGDGAGAAGAESGARTGAGPSGTSGGDGGLGTPRYCEDFCAQLSIRPACKVDSGCVQDCLAEFAEAGACAPALDAFARCLLDVPGCDDDHPLCAQKWDAYRGCLQQQGCGEVSCQAGGSSQGITDCACERTCKGQEQLARCIEGPNQLVQCECALDGQLVGVCQADTDASAACDLDGGCCAPFFPK